jgi:hypothetical protein
VQDLTKTNELLERKLNREAVQFYLDKKKIKEGIIVTNKEFVETKSHVDRLN